MPACTPALFGASVPSKTSDIKYNSSESCQWMSLPFLTGVRSRQDSATHNLLATCFWPTTPVSRPGTLWSKQCCTVVQPPAVDKYPAPLDRLLSQAALCSESDTECLTFNGQHTSQDNCMQRFRWIGCPNHSAVPMPTSGHNPSHTLNCHWCQTSCCRICLPQALLHTQVKYHSVQVSIAVPQIV